MCRNPKAIDDSDGYASIYLRLNIGFKQKMVKISGKIIQYDKNGNDTKGHVFGDQVLVDVATIIKRSIRGNHFADGINVTISGGIKQYMGEELRDFIHEADKNMYKAKKNGKNQIVSK